MTDEPLSFNELGEQLAKLAELINATNADLRWCLKKIQADHGITDEELENVKR